MKPTSVNAAIRCRFEADGDGKPPNVAEYISMRFVRRFRQGPLLIRLRI